VFLQCSQSLCCPTGQVIRRLGCRNRKVYACDISCCLLQLHVLVLSLVNMQLMSVILRRRVICWRYVGWNEIGLVVGWFRIMNLEGYEFNDGIYFDWRIEEHTEAECRGREVQSSLRRLDIINVFLLLLYPSPQANDGLAHEIRPRPFNSTSFPILYSLLSWHSLSYWQHYKIDVIILLNKCTMQASSRDTLPLRLFE
jgi:hypothetical protein